MGGAAAGRPGGLWPPFLFGAKSLNHALANGYAADVRQWLSPAVCSLLGISGDAPPSYFRCEFYGGVKLPSHSGRRSRSNESTLIAT